MGKGTIDKQTLASLEVLNTEEAAAYLGVRAQTLKGWRLRGVGPKCSALGKILRWRRDDLDAFLLDMQNPDKQSIFCAKISRKSKAKASTETTDDEKAS